MKRVELVLIRTKKVKRVGALLVVFIVYADVVALLMQAESFSFVNSRFVCLLFGPFSPPPFFSRASSLELPLWSFAL